MTGQPNNFDADALIQYTADVMAQDGAGWRPSAKQLLTALAIYAYRTPQDDGLPGAFYTGVGQVEDDADDDADVTVTLNGAARAIQRLGIVGGMCVDTIADNLRQLHRAGLITRVTQRHAPTTPDGSWASTTTLRVSRTPKALPHSLPTCPARQRAATRAELHRAAFRALRQVTCACGSVGNFTVTCRDCGRALPDPESDAQDGPQATGAETFRAADTPHFDTGEDITSGPESFPSNHCVSDYNGDFPGAADESLTARGSAPDAQTTPRQVEDDADARPVSDLPAEGLTTGAATVQYLAQLGAGFTFARGKAAYRHRWQTTPETAQDAMGQLGKGDNIGILCGVSTRSDGVVLGIIDVDDDAPEFLRAHPELAAAPRVFRHDAPRRVKLIIGVEGSAAETFRARVDNGAAHPIEFLGARHHGIVAGRHATTGAPIVCAPGQLIVKRLGDWLRLCRSWAQPMAKDMTTPITAQAAKDDAPSASWAKDAPSGSCDDLRHAAIGWWCAQPGNIARVDALLSGCRQANGRYAIRPDDRTPSASWAKDGYGRRIMRDYGAAGRAATMDDAELFCVLTSMPKRAFVRQTVIDYCRAHGRAIPKGLQRAMAA